MKDNYFSLQMGLIVMILVVTIGGWSPVAAQPFLPEKAFRIETRYSPPASDIMGPLVTWHLSFTPMETGGALRYEIDGSGLFCRLETKLSEQGMTFTLYGDNDQTIDSASGAFIPFAGFPAPSRVFPLPVFDQPGEFTMVREAGNRRFLNQFYFTITPVSVEDALRKDLLDHDQYNLNTDIELVWVQVTNASGEPLFRQLWEKDSDWWLYEETEDSRSWKRE